MTKQQRCVLIVSILASFVAFLDGSVVTVALPAIARDLGGGFAVQQWVVDAYLITLGALILIAGSLSDLFGRKRILTIGIVGFLATSLMCAAAPNGPVLILARALQGIAGALLVPSSLALIMSVFSGPAQSKAIGLWTAWTGTSYVIGPLLGGFLVDAVSWRLIFAINIMPTLVTLWLMRSLHEVKEVRDHVYVDLKGAVLCVAGLAGPVYALIEQARYGWRSPLVISTLAAGLAAFTAFIWYERRAKEPMLPLSLFKNRNFGVGNIATTAIYGGLSVAMLLISVFVQQVGHYSALRAGLSLLPVTVIMFILSARFGALAGKFGPRFFMAVGPIIVGVAFLSMARLDAHILYWTRLFPSILLFGFGLSMTVAPLTSAILGAIGRERAGIASAVNNAVARIAGLVAVAAIGVITGAQLSVTGFRRGIVATALLLIAGGVISAIGIQNAQGRG